MTPSAEQLVSVFLVTYLGTMVDLGKTDTEILALCSFMLSRIRAAKGNPAMMERIANLTVDLKGGE